LHQTPFLDLDILSELLYLAYCSSRQVCDVICCQPLARSAAAYACYVAHGRSNSLHVAVLKPQNKARFSVFNGMGGNQTQTCNCCNKTAGSQAP
jgi:hypothetical protein